MTEAIIKKVNTVSTTSLTVEVLAYPETEKAKNQIQIQPKDKNSSAPFYNEKWIRKKYSGSLDIFTYSQSKNYNYCKTYSLTKGEILVPNYA